MFITREKGDEEEAAIESRDTRKRGPNATVILGGKDRTIVQHHMQERPELSDPQIGSIGISDVTAAVGRRIRRRRR